MLKKILLTVVFAMYFFPGYCAQNQTTSKILEDFIRDTNTYLTSRFFNNPVGRAPLQEKFKELLKAFSAADFKDILVQTCLDFLLRGLQVVEYSDNDARNKVFEFIKNLFEQEGLTLTCGEIDKFKELCHWSLFSSSDKEKELKDLCTQAKKARLQKIRGEIAQKKIDLDDDALFVLLQELSDNNDNALIKLQEGDVEKMSKKLDGCDWEASFGKLISKIGLLLKMSVIDTPEFVQRRKELMEAVVTRIVQSTFFDDDQKQKKVIEILDKYNNPADNRAVYYLLFDLLPLDERGKQDFSSKISEIENYLPFRYRLGFYCHTDKISVREVLSFFCLKKEYAKVLTTLKKYWSDFVWEGNKDEQILKEIVGSLVDVFEKQENDSALFVLNELTKEFCSHADGFYNDLFDQTTHTENQIGQILQKISLENIPQFIRSLENVAEGARKLRVGLFAEALSRRVVVNGSFDLDAYTKIIQGISRVYLNFLNIYRNKQSELLAPQAAHLFAALYNKVHQQRKDAATGDDYTANCLEAAEKLMLFELRNNETLLTKDVRTDLPESEVLFSQAFTAAKNAEDKAEKASTSQGSGCVRLAAGKRVENVFPEISYFYEKLNSLDKTLYEKLNKNKGQEKLYSSILPLVGIGTVGVAGCLFWYKYRLGRTRELSTKNTLPLLAKSALVSSRPGDVNLTASLM